MISPHAHYDPTKCEHCGGRLERDEFGNRPCGCKGERILDCLDKINEMGLPWAMTLLYIEDPNRYGDFEPEFMEDLREIIGDYEPEKDCPPTERMDHMLAIATMQDRKATDGLIKDAGFIIAQALVEGGNW